MSPIERVRARAAALQELGVAHGACPDEIRKAWRRVAFEAHPDHGARESAQFSRAKAAYDMLRGEIRDAVPTAPSVPATAQCAVPRRPRVRPRIVETLSAEREACRALLDANNLRPGDISFTVGGSSAVPEAWVTRAGRPAQDHVVAAVECQGRQLTYLIAAPCKAGVNRVALPASVLEHARLAKPQIVTFECLRDSIGTVDVPKDLLEHLFPGARSVGFRFAATLGLPGDREDDPDQAA